MPGRTGTCVPYDQSQRAVPIILAHLQCSHPDTFPSSEPEGVCKVDEQGCLLAF